MPTDTTPLATTTATTTAQALQQLQQQAAQQAHAFGQNFFAGYLSYLGLFEFFGVVITLLFLAGIIYIGLETNWFKYRIENFKHIVLHSNISKKHAQESWHRVEAHFYNGSDSDLKIAILEADKLLNDALRDAGIMGVQLGDRLKKADTTQIPNLNELWQAHRLRNQIAHEPNFRLNRDLAEKALAIYETAFKNLGVFTDQPEQE